MANPDIVKMITSNKNSKRRGYTGGKKILRGQWEHLLAQFDGECAYCGSRERITQDHVIPLSKGGEHDIGNILPACHSCNCKKHNKNLLVWMFTK